MGPIERFLTGSCCWYTLFFAFLALLAYYLRQKHNFSRREEGVWLECQSLPNLASNEQTAESTTVPRVPIFIYEPHDLTAFASVSDAERWLEAVDVNAGAYIGFDAEGHRLLLNVNNRAVEIRRGNAVERQESELEKVLRGWLKRIDDPNWENPVWDLDALVAYCAERARENV